MDIAGAQVDHDLQRVAHSSLTVYHTPVVFIASLALGGAERILMDWVAAYKRPTKIVVLWNAPQEYAVPHHVQLTRLNGKNINAELANIARDLKKSNYPFAVVCHLLRDAHLQTLWSEGVATVPVYHNTREAWLCMPKRCERNHAPIQIAVAQRVAEQLIEDGASHVVTLRHQTPLRTVLPARRQAIRQWLGAADSTIVLCAVGSFKAQKAYDRLAEVLAELRINQHDVRLVIAGGWSGGGQRAERERLLRNAFEYRVREHIFLTGPIHNVADLLTASDVFVNVSLHEGYSIATAEALAAGLPCVVTDVGGQREHKVTHAEEKLHFISEPFHAQTFAATVIKTFADSIAASPIQNVVPAPSRSSYSPLEWTLAACIPTQALTKPGATFITANLKLGGAQRSLARLLCALTPNMKLQLLVCEDDLQTPIAQSIVAKNLPCEFVIEKNNVYLLTATLAQHIVRAGYKNVVFWNVDPRVKLLLTKWMSWCVSVIDVSPGPALFDELTATENFQQLIAYNTTQYFSALHLLVHKYHSTDSPIALQRLATIPNGVEAQEIEPRLFQLSAPRILVCGRIHPDKHILECIEVIRLLRQIIPHAKLVLAGSARARDAVYEASVKAAAGVLRGNVEWLGEVSDVSDVMQSADLLLVLSSRQGCPNVILEAMQNGLPVVANDSGGTRELLQIDYGWLVTSTDAQLAADAVLRALSSESILQSKRLAAAKHIAAEYSIDLMVSRYKKILEE